MTSSPTHLSVVLIVAGPFVGSFLGLLAYRIPRNEGFLWGRSHCPDCGTKLRFIDLFPLLSWLALRRKCRHCSAPISARYPLIELAATAIAVWAVFAVPPFLVFITCLLGWSLLTLAVIDAETFLLPDAMTLPLILCGIAMALYLDSNIVAHALAAFFAFATFRLIGFAFLKLRGFEGLGHGDAKLAAAAGAWVAIAGLPTVLLWACAAAFVGILAAILCGRSVSRTTPIPFGTCLCIGLWLVWLYGPVSL